MATYTEALQKLYVAYFTRPADVRGLAYWESVVEAAGGNTAAVSAAFAASAEYKAAYANMSNLQIVNKVYNNLFGHDADLAGLNYWVDLLEAKAITIDNVVAQIAGGAQGTDATAYANKVTAATNFTNGMDTTAEVLAYESAAGQLAGKSYVASVTTDASLATATTDLAAALSSMVTAGTPPPAVTVFTLTTGVDTGTAFAGTAGNDTFNATGTTFTALDTIDGGTGVNTFNLVDANGNFGSGMPALSKVTNMQTVNVTTVATLGNVTSAGTAAVAEQKTYTFPVPAAGTDTITFSVNGTTITTGQLGATATTAGDAFVAALNAAAGATVAVNAAGVVTVTAPTAGTPFPVTFTGATNALDFPAVATTVANVVASGATTAAVFDLSGATGLQKYVVSANGNVNTAAPDAATVDITTTKGAVTVDGGADVSVKINANPGAVNLSGDALTKATVTGGTTVTVTDNGEDTLTTVSVGSNTGAVSLTGDKLVNVSLASTSAAATITNTTVDHTLNLGVFKVTGGATIADATAKTVNMTVTGTTATAQASNVNLDLDAATTLNITNSAALTLTTTALAADDDLTAVTIKGAGNVTANFTGVAPLASIDNTGSSGRNTLTVDNIAALSIKGGTGSDRITINGALDAKANIALGAGNDIYTFTTAAAAGALVSGGDGTGDVLTVNNGALLDAAAAKVYSGFEVLSVSGGQGTYDMSLLGLTSVTAAAALAGTTNISNAAAGTTVSLSSGAGATTTTGFALNYALKDATGKTDSVTLNLTANDGTSDGAANGSVVATSFNAAGIESVTVTSNVTAVDTDDADTPLVDESTVAKQYSNKVVTLAIDNASTLTLTGSSSLVIDTVKSDSLTKIDASAATGNVTITNAVQDAAAGSSNAPITYLGGAAVDTYVASALGDLIAGNAGADVITLGAGKDTLSYAKASDSILTLKDTTTPADGVSDTKSGYDVITGFSSTNDKIDISSLNLATGAARGALTLKTLTADTAAGVQTLIGTGTKFFNDGVANRAVAFATDGTNGYVFVDANGDGNYTAGTDMVISLVGVTALVVSDISFG